MSCSCGFLQPAEARWRVLWTCILPVSVEREGVLPRRQGLLPLLSVVSSQHAVIIHLRCQIISKLQLSRQTNWEFTPSQQSSANSSCHNQGFISSTDANFSESDLSWRVLRYESGKWLNPISIILGYGRTEGGQENRRSHCLTRSSVALVPVKRSVCTFWKTFSQKSPSVSWASVSPPIWG